MHESYMFYNFSMLVLYGKNMNTYFMSSDIDIGKIREFLTGRESSFRIYYYTITVLYIGSMIFKLFSLLILFSKMR